MSCSRDWKVDSRSGLCALNPYLSQLQGPRVALGEVWAMGRSGGVPRGPLTPNVVRRVWLSVLFTDFTVVRHSVAWKGKDVF